MNTEILLPVPELKIALSGLNKLVSKRSTLPVLSHIRITRESNGLVKLQGTDLDGFATFTLNNTQVGEGVDVLVPLEQLNKASKCSTPKDAVALVLEGQNTRIRYNIAGSPVHQQVNTLPASEWPQQPSITAEGHPLPPTFGEALKQALECVGDDPQRLTLCGACLDARDPKAHYIIGTNGRFLFAANSFSFGFKEDVIIPDSKFITGSGLLDSPECSLVIQPGKKPDDLKHVCLQTKQWQFVTRQIDGQYPNWKSVLAEVDSNWTKIRLDEAAVNQLLKVIPNLPGNDQPNHTIRLRTDQSCFWVEGRNKEDKDWTSIAVNDVTITGKMREINLNRDYFMPALRFGLSDLAILDELTPIVCSKEGKKIVIMPVRPPQQTKQEPAKAPVPVPKDQPPVTSPQPQPAPTPPPQPLTEPTTKPAQERKTEMTTKATTATSTTTQPVKTTETSPSLLDQIEQVKESAKNLVRDLTSLSDGVKQAEKDRRANEKELENARSVLKKLQEVKF